MVKSILIADDDKSIRELLEEILTGEGYNVLLAEDGGKALQIFKERNISLAILDIQLPKINGIELLKIMKEMKDIPTIIISGAATPATLEKIKELKAEAFLTKPFHREDITSTVKNVMEKAYQLKILVVDDHPETRDLLKTILEEENDVETAEDGEIAVNKASLKFYNIVFMDIHMPRVDGIDATRKIKRISPKTYVVVMTGEAEDSEIRKALTLDAGYYSIIRKPFKKSDIITLMKQFREEIKMHIEKIETQPKGMEIVFIKLKGLTRTRLFKQGIAVLIFSIIVGYFLAMYFLPFTNYVSNFFKNSQTWMDKVEGYLQRDEEREMEK